MKEVKKKKVKKVKKREFIFHMKPRNKLHLNLEIHYGNYTINIQFSIIVSTCIRYQLGTTNYVNFNNSIAI